MAFSIGRLSGTRLIGLAGFGVTHQAIEHEQDAFPVNRRRHLQGLPAFQQGLVSECGQLIFTPRLRLATRRSLRHHPLWQAEVSGTTWQFHYFQTDHLGTPKLATNPQGQITWQAQAEAFGQTTPDPNSTITVNLRFPGQYFDEESGLHYNYFRDYDPQTGRYVQSDPIGLEGGLIRMGMVMKIGDFQHRRHGDRAIAPGRAADRPDHGDLGGGKLGMDSPRTRGMEPQRGPGVAPCDGRGVRDAFFGGD